MGLYLVQQLAQRLGGNCQYTSTTETVRFELCIPVVDTSKVQNLQ
jgi:sensor histidine kinase regulating citrate/malate metabolism